MKQVLKKKTNEKKNLLAKLKLKEQLKQKKQKLMIVKKIINQLKNHQ